MYPNLDSYDVIALDTETTGLDFKKDRVFSFSISLPDGKDFYFDNRENIKCMEWLHNAIGRFQSRGGLVVNHNIKFDIHMLREAGVHVDPTMTQCTSIRACLIDEHLRSYSLDSLAKKYLKNTEKDDEIYVELAAIFGGKPTRAAQVKNFPRAPIPIMGRYAKQDTRVALELYLWQEEEIKRQGLEEVVALERRLFPHIVEMERRGIRVDLNEAERQAEIIDIRVKDIRSQLNRMAGFEVNPNPSNSIKELFKPKWDAEKGCFVAIDGTPVGKTDAGKPSLNAEALKRMKHPAAGLILQARTLIKTADTFLRGHIIGHAHNGYVHPNINQTKGDDGGTGTGRLSYTGPALQQIPARNKTIAAICRPCFLPDEGQDWSYGDLDQHEYRVFAHYVNNPAVIAEYQENPDLDFHKKIADLTGLPRSAPEAGGANAKQLNLGMVFCMGAGHMADMCGMDWTWDSFIDERGNEVQFQRAGAEALELVEEYHRKVVGVREIAARAKSIAKRRGYVRTIFGRHIRFPRGYGARKASGLIYQGSSADLNKLNICVASEYLASEAPESRLLLNIHDEYSFSLARDGRQVEHLRAIKDLIQDKPMLRTPIRIDFSNPAANWWDATCADVCTK